MRRILIPLALAALLVGGGSTASAETEFTVLAYHDVVDHDANLTFDAITLRNLSMHFDWLRQNGYRVVSVDDLVAAQRGERPMPPRAVLLTFDDGYRSFYTHVYPLLTAFNYPAVLSVVGSFLDVPPRAQVRFGSDLVAREDFVSWEQLRELRRSGLVEIGSHTFGLHTTIFTNPQGGEVPAAVGQGFIRRRSGPRIREEVPVQMPQPRFGDVRSLLNLAFQPFLGLAINLAQAAIDFAYDPRTGRYETDGEYRDRIRADLERNSDLLEAHLGVRPRVITWPYGRWNAMTVEAAREAGMPISLTLDVERGDVRELGRVGRFYATNRPDLSFMSSVFSTRLRPELLRGLCVNMDEIYASTEEEQEERLGRILDRIVTFRPSMVLLTAGSSVPGAGVYFPTDRLPVRADIFSRVVWQIFTRAGSEVYPWLPVDKAGPDVDTAVAVYGALARSVPFQGISIGELPGEPAPASARTGAEGGLDRWDPRTPRRLRAGINRTPLSPRATDLLRLYDAVARYQPAVRVLDILDLSQLRRPTEMPVDAVDYVAVRWDGRPAEAIRRLKDLGWLEGDHWGRLVYMSARGVPAEWRRVQAAGVINNIYCPERLLDGPSDLAGMGGVAGAAWFPFRP